MRLPSPLQRRNPKAYKNQFGHALILAGSPSMLGAAALVGLACMRSGAGLTTIGVPKSLNAPLQEKISSVIMTLSLPETKENTLSESAYLQISKNWQNYEAMALGPGLSHHPQTMTLMQKIIGHSPIPLVIDADALTGISKNIDILLKTKTPKVLTPHPGEMSRLTGLSVEQIEKSRKKTAQHFAQSFGCILVLKGQHTLVAGPLGEHYSNTTGNVGLATAGSGDVLTGIITSFLAQGIKPFDAARLGVYLHGLAGDLAAKEKTKAGMIATDIIEYIPQAFKKLNSSS